MSTGSNVDGITVDHAAIAAAATAASAAAAAPLALGSTPGSTNDVLAATVPDPPARDGSDLDDEEGTPSEIERLRLADAADSAVAAAAANPEGRAPPAAAAKRTDAEVIRTLARDLAAANARLATYAPGGATTDAATADMQRHAASLFRDPRRSARLASRTAPPRSPSAASAAMTRTSATVATGSTSGSTVLRSPTAPRTPSAPSPSRRASSDATGCPSRSPPRTRATPPPLRLARGTSTRHGRGISRSPGRSSFPIPFRRTSSVTTGSTTRSSSPFSCPPAASTRSAQPATTSSRSARRSRRSPTRSLTRQPSRAIPSVAPAHESFSPASLAQRFMPLRRSERLRAASARPPATLPVTAAEGRAATVPAAPTARAEAATVAVETGAVAATVAVETVAATPAVGAPTALGAATLRPALRRASSPSRDGARQGQGAEAPARRHHLGPRVVFPGNALGEGTRGAPGRAAAAVATAVAECHTRFGPPGGENARWAAPGPSRAPRPTGVEHAGIERLGAGHDRPWGEDPMDEPSPAAAGPPVPRVAGGRGLLGWRDPAAAGPRIRPGGDGPGGVGAHTGHFPGLCRAVERRRGADGHGISVPEQLHGAADVPL